MTRRRRPPARPYGAARPARLGPRFFARPTLAVAESLLGRLLVFEGPRGPVGGRIVEVEAYIGEDDPACHAACGRTERNRVMWGPAGRAYVYFTYGMHHCLNLVTEADGFPAAVLIRALDPCVGTEAIERRAGRPAEGLLTGPGRVCAGLGLHLEHNGMDLARGPLWVGRGRCKPAGIARGPRIGIRVGGDRPWRLHVAGHPAVSRPRAGPPARRRPGPVHASGLTRP